MLIFEPKHLQHLHNGMDDDREQSLSKFVDDTNVRRVVETKNGRPSPEIL